MICSEAPSMNAKFVRRMTIKAINDFVGPNSSASRLLIYSAPHCPGLLYSQPAQQWLPALQHFAKIRQLCENILHKVKYALQSKLVAVLTSPTLIHPRLDVMFLFTAQKQIASKAHWQLMTLLTKALQCSYCFHLYLSGSGWLFQKFRESNRADSYI